MLLCRLVERFLTVLALAAAPVTVAAADQTPRVHRQGYAGYLFTYFTGEGTADGEQVYFALSQGNDPLHWRELNDGDPVLTSTLGEQGVRDPFIIRAPEGNKFYLIATDLRIYGNGDWDGAQRHGSLSIMVWESTDLVRWTDKRLVRVSPDTAGNTWAPEAFYDGGLGAYVVFWASKIYAADDPDHTGNTYNKMMYATTRDFRTFSLPQVWKYPGYSVIDSTLIAHNGTYYRFTKDERDPSSSSPCSEFLIEERSTQIVNPTTTSSPSASARARSAGARARPYSSRTRRRSGISSSTSSAVVVTSRSNRPTWTRAYGPRRPATPFPRARATARSCRSRSASTTGCSGGTHRPRR